MSKHGILNHKHCYKCDNAIEWNDIEYHRDKLYCKDCYKEVIIKNETISDCYFNLGIILLAIGVIGTPFCFPLIFLIPISLTLLAHASRLYDI